MSLFEIVLCVILAAIAGAAMATAIIYYIFQKHYDRLIDSLEWKLHDAEEEARNWKHWTNVYKRQANEYKRTMYINITEIPKGDNIPVFGDEHETN